ncbi:uncharacterized protein LOC143414929 [Maylandia zebra]|uniref:uncharacterized protein LOC143414929 n=1 Tax=Maylandia zebra TaxID=106582 RepID=UPI00403D3EE8
MYCGEQSSSVKDVLAVPGSIRSSRGMSSLVSFTTCSRSCAWMTADSSAITVGQFEDLLSLVGPSIARLDTNYRRSIPPAERLSVCLRFLVTGDSFRTIAFSFRVGVSTVSQITPQAATSIWDCLVDDFMAVPSPGDWRSITEGLQERWNFPLCCAALDGKHIQTKAPHISYRRHTH